MFVPGADRFSSDCWEHAYYLQYLNVKADYFKNIWYVSQLTRTTVSEPELILPVRLGLSSTGPRLKAASRLPPNKRRLQRAPANQAQCIDSK